MTARMDGLRFRSWLRSASFVSSAFPITIEQESLEIRRLHAWKGVAPLKLSTPPANVSAAPSLHAWKGVAPLKLPDRGHEAGPDSAVSTPGRAWPH